MNLNIEKVRAVLFDMDGVLYDSMPNHAYSWHNAMKECGIVMSEAQAYEWEGMRGVEVIKNLVEQQQRRTLSDDEAQEMYNVKARFFAERPAACMMPGAKELLQKLHDAGKTIVVVTGSGQKTLLDKLVRDFEELILPDMIVSSKDVNQGKPHPEPYLKGLAKAGVSAEEAVVVENAPLGIRAAKAAGITTIAVNTGPLPDSMLTAEGAAVVFPSMKHVVQSLEYEAQN